MMIGEETEMQPQYSSGSSGGVAAEEQARTHAPAERLSPLLRAVHACQHGLEETMRTLLVEEETLGDGPDGVAEEGYAGDGGALRRVHQQEGWSTSANRQSRRRKGAVLADAVDDDGCSLLQWAAINNRVDVAELLLEHGAVLRHCGGVLQENALQWAVRQEHVHMADLLLWWEEHEHPDRARQMNDEALGLRRNTMAVNEDENENGHATTFEMGEDERERRTREKIAAAAASEQGQVRGHGSRQEFPSLLGNKNVQGQDALHLAIRVGNLNMIFLLLSKGANPNSMDATGLTPISWLCRNRARDHEMLRLLLAMGADPNVADPEFGNTAVHWMAQQPSRVVPILDILLTAGKADDLRTNKEGLTPLGVSGSRTPGVTWYLAARRVKPYLPEHMGIWGTAVGILIFALCVHHLGWLYGILLSMVLQMLVVSPLTLGQLPENDARRPCGYALGTILFCISTYHLYFAQHCTTTTNFINTVLHFGVMFTFYRACNQLPYYVQLDETKDDLLNKLLGRDPAVFAHSLQMHSVASTKATGAGGAAGAAGPGARAQADGTTEVQMTQIVGSATADAEMAAEEREEEEERRVATSTTSALLHSAAEVAVVAVSAAGDGRSFADDLADGGDNDGMPLRTLGSLDHPATPLVNARKQARTSATAAAAGARPARMCTTCLLDKNRGSTHCAVCNRCILLLDHHCPFVNNCVAHGNRKAFMYFLIGADAALIGYVITAFYVISILYPDLFIVNAFCRYLVQTRAWGMALALAIFNLIWIFCLFVSQLYLIGTDVTTHEMIKHDARARRVRWNTRRALRRIWHLFATTAQPGDAEILERKKQYCAHMLGDQASSSGGVGAGSAGASSSSGGAAVAGSSGGAGGHDLDDVEAGHGHRGLRDPAPPAEDDHIALLQSNSASSSSSTATSRTSILNV